MLKVAQVEDYLPSVRLEDIPIESRWMAEEIGMDAMKALCRAGGGNTLYIPKIEGICKEARNRMLREEFNGENSKELGKRYGLSPRYVRQLASERR